MEFDYRIKLTRLLVEMASFMQHSCASCSGIGPYDLPCSECKSLTKAIKDIKPYAAEPYTLDHTSQ